VSKQIDALVKAETFLRSADSALWLDPELASGDLCANARAHVKRLSGHLENAKQSLANAVHAQKAHEGDQ
jgi:hypothetical protein